MIDMLLNIVVLLSAFFAAGIATYYYSYVNRYGTGRLLRVHIIMISLSLITIAYGLLQVIQTLEVSHKWILFSGFFFEDLSLILILVHLLRRGHRLSLLQERKKL